ncbi:hypothetical protein [Deinococcus soli (ex Cha et al. 2016)]|uniref:Uncharacterized protein n=1 Tax=Deinococcus soli (ex Cha et al. 2016) TaxID=1309411 RepID=A0ACC6KP54_9DEIO|nr:hypothetical protein [Deinococcus soli (ex Cha et al. 2016)]MDR6330591.1 hypothetical protein [Deinococcus soli (ex Cha et al. 2016)]MDR6754368.1 hypothetical protein [Deinococcus soli (ex Cha et al. 2016)]
MTPAPVYLPTSEADLKRWTSILPRDEAQLGDLARHLAGHVQEARANMHQVVGELELVQRATDIYATRQAQLLATQRLLGQIQRGRALPWEILPPGQHTWMIAPARPEGRTVPTGAPEAPERTHALRLRQAQSGAGLTGVYQGTAYFSPHTVDGQPNGADHALAAELDRSEGDGGIPGPCAIC